MVTLVKIRVHVGTRYVHVLSREPHFNILLMEVGGGGRGDIQGIFWGLKFWPKWIFLGL